MTNLSSIRRTEILAEALAARFNRNPERLADASGVYVRSAALAASAALYAPGAEGDAPPVIAISRDARGPSRDFLIAWALGLWVLGYGDRAVYWRSLAGGSARVRDPADEVATAFATAFLGRGWRDLADTGTAPR
jgi:hypothetical protein